MEAVLFIMVTMGIILFGVACAHAARDRHRRALAALGSGLAKATIDESRSRVTGMRRGFAIAHELTTHGAGSDSEPWTHVTIAIGPAPLALHVEQHRSGDSSKIARGDMVDIVVGDSEFDRKYRVEGGPEEIVKRVLSAGLVRAMTAVDSELEIVTEDGQPCLRYAVRGWFDTVAKADPLWDRAVQFRRDFERAHAELDDAVPLGQIGSPYRPEPDDLPLRASRAQRAFEARAVESLRERRIAGERATGNTIALVMFGLAMLVMALIATGSR